jgi:hypothetical protein
MQDTPVSATPGFLLGHSHVSSLHLLSPIWNKMNIFPLENPERQAIILSKLTPFLQGNNMQETPASTTHGFLPRNTHVSSIQQHRSVLYKMNAPVS